jgi:abnormal spindle-like microcephaly-associated protein
MEILIHYCVNKCTGTGNASFEPDGCGLKELLNKRAEGVNRQKSSELHRKQSRVMKTVEQAVCDKSFKMRNDRDILVDLGLQDALLTILLSYEMSWIRLGLETVFGEIIPHPSSTLKSQKIYHHPCRTGCPKWKTTVRTFVLERMFTYQNQNHNQKSKSSYDQNVQDITRECIVKKFFALVLFLDAAKIQEILVIPTLFVVNSGMKSSKDVILAFSKGLLQGQGDVIKHLGQIGYSVSFIQSYVFEFNFTVSNLLVRNFIRQPYHSTAFASAFSSAVAFA